MVPPGGGVGGSPTTPGGTAGSSGADSTPPPPLDMVVLDECPGPLSPEVVQQLRSGFGTAPPELRLLYPYDATVFPRGIEAPVVQWDPPQQGSEGIVLRMRSRHFEYVGCLSPTGPGRVQIPQTVWEQAGRQSTGRPDPLHIEVVTRAGGQVARLPDFRVTFALANLHNAIYYNTYGSLLALQQGIVGGVVMRITPRRPVPEVFIAAQQPGNCVGCHSVAANGSTLVAAEHVLPGLAEGPGGLYDLTSQAGVRPTPIRNDLRRTGFSGVYPDGSLYLTTGRTQPGPITLGGTPHVTGTFGPEASKLYDARSGAEIPNSGIPPNAFMPSFSTDGRMVTFNHVDDNGNGGRRLAIMDFDRDSTHFSNLRELYTHPSRFPGWPVFLPYVDAGGEFSFASRRVVFALGDQPDFVTQTAPIALVPHFSDLWWVDVDSGEAAPLGRAGGFEGTSNVLPYGERDAHRDFFPTVSPVPAGGYYWLFFTSRRNYGNMQVAPTDIPAENKKIWVSALDIDAPPGSDPSHPAFYLPGQELEAGNIRAFAALEPCRTDGQACETGVDCCGGYCTNGMCGRPEERCAEIDERCTTTADCCDPSAACVGGFCSIILR